MSEQDNKPTDAELVGLSRSSPPSGADPSNEKDSAGGSSSPNPPGSPPNDKKTRLHALCAKYWGVTFLDEYDFSHVIKYVNPDMAGENKDNSGFAVLLKQGSPIQWSVYRDAKGTAQEIIYKQKKEKSEFTQGDAHALVALAKLRGWKRMDLHGTPEQQEKLWIAIDIRNRVDFQAFKADQESGKIPKTDQDGNPINFKPIEVTNFHPSSRMPEIVHRFRKAFDEYELINGKVIPETFPASDTVKVKEDLKKTEPEAIKPQPAAEDSKFAGKAHARAKKPSQSKKSPPKKAKSAHFNAKAKPKAKSKAPAKPQIKAQIKVQIKSPAKSHPKPKPPKAKNKPHRSR